MINHKNTNPISLTIKNLSLWQFMIVHSFLAILLFFSKILANDITGLIYLFLFLFLPMIGFLFTLKNSKNNYNLLVFFQFLVWFCALSILGYLDDNFLKLDFGLIVFPQENLLQNLLVIIGFLFFGIFFLSLTKYANNDKKSLTPLIFIPIMIEFYVDGLIGMVISFFLIGAMAVWVMRLLLENSFKKSQIINLILSIISLIFFEVNAYYQNHLTEYNAKKILNQVIEYKNKTGQYPNSETIMIDRNYIKYHFNNQNTDNQCPYFYWQEFKNPYCRHRFNFETQEWVRYCKY